MTTTLTTNEAHVLGLVRAHGGFHVDGTGAFAKTVRTLAAQGLVTYDRAEGLVTARCAHCGYDLDDGICPTCCDLADHHAVELSDVHAAYELVAIDGGTTTFDQALDIVTAGADR